MRGALVTGATGGIGAACVAMLLERGYHVYGIARRFQETHPFRERFTPLACDLRDPRQIQALDRGIERSSLEVVVHAAGIGHFAPHAYLDPAKIEEMIALNLTAPLLLDRLLLSDLQRNRAHLFYIASFAGMEASAMGATYGATKAALTHYARALFKEVRKSGVRVTTIVPDITRTPFFERLHFAPTDDPSTYIEPEDIAALIGDALQMREGSVVTEIVVQPQRFRLHKKGRKSES